ncbi:hypothetical protein [Lichenihabitans psoromatis]|uniref:hypothetical protein n=1 Tax=Lichenihabitans psoromatis TaxID=2528642 RepID=UPI001036A0CC|nr:hypothetical protein [Lichenihabitans psoromatis]
MMNDEQCLAHLETLSVSKEPSALVQAEVYIEDLLQSSLSDRAGAADTLGDIQAQLLRRTPSSPQREDIVDLLGDKIARLLEPE